jgi:PAS domain S-box-containing protein
MDDEHKTKRQLIAELGALRQVFDGAGDAICIVGLDGRILEVNRAAQECLGYSHAEMLEMTLTDIHPVDQAPMVAQHMASVHEQGSVLFETTQRRRDGATVPVEVHARPVEFNGTPAVLSVVREITQRKPPEEVLLRTLIDSVPMAVYVKDKHSRFVLANQGIAEVMGVATPDGLLGKTDFDFFPHDVAAGFYAGEQELMRSGRPVVNQEELTLDAAANRRYFLNTTVPWRDAAGDIVGLVGASLDITERKRAEEALRQQKEILQTVLDNAPVATEFLRPDGSLQWANRTAERILGWSLAERQAPELFQQCYPDPQERRRALEFIARADGTWEDFRERRRDGSVVDISWANVRLPDGSIVGIGQDISERKRAEADKERLQAQLLQSQRMEAVGQLAAGIAHDFNNLLTAILGFAELLQLGMPPQDQRQEMVSHILTGGQRAAVLVNQLLGFARRQMIAPRELNLNEIVAGASATVRRDLEATIDLTVLPAPDLWQVTVDPEQFTRVIHDLALNARRAMPGGGRLTIETANVTFKAEDVRARPEIQPGGYVLLAVGDTGAGMSQEAAARVFEPFFFTSREVATGVGLRMAAVYGIVKQNHGYVYADSREGAGTTIKVYLPRGEAPQNDPRGVGSRA